MASRDELEILVRDELVAVTDEAIAALCVHGGLYVRARMLVQLGQADGLEDPSTRLTRAPGAPVIVPVTTAALRDVLDHAARWVKAAGRKQKTRVPTLPPTWVAEQVLARTAWPFVPLEGVVSTPVLRADGTVLATPGYDRLTGLFYEPIEDFPAVATQPTRADAHAAVRRLLDPVNEFPFTDECGRAAYIAAVLSLVGRYAIDGPTPGIPITSPTAGTGKTLLARIIAIIGTGRPAATMSQSREDDELRKRILAIGLAGTPLVALDNLSGVLGSDVLAAALTTTTWSDRMLGVSTVVEVPLRTVWLFTGNNLSFKKTLGRRMVPVYLDAGVEHPEDRRFTIENLVGHVQTARPALVIAALTILRAYALAGRPRHAAPPMGSFEAWDAWIRGACIWAGLADPAEADNPLVARGRIRATLDEDRESLGVLLELLAEAFGERLFLVAEVIDRALPGSALRLALEEIGAVNRDGQVTGRAIGYKFRDAESRIVGGRQLVTHHSEGHRKQRLWRVLNGNGRRVASDAGNAGDVLGPSDDGKFRDVFLGLEGCQTSPAIPASPADVEDRYAI